MNIYKIADLKIKLDCSERTMRNAVPYLLKGYDGEYDFEIKQNTKAALADFYEQWQNYRETADFLYETRQFYNKILDYGAMMLHASAVAVDNEAYLFSASSGTGKSTHTRLWLEKFGERAFILNDDKPIIRILNDGIYAYGAPWCGSSDIGRNAKVPLKAICFIERAESNTIRRMTAEDGMPVFMNMFYQTFRQLDCYACMTPITRENAAKYLDIIAELIEAVPIYQMGCNMDPEAADVAYEGMR